jgi:LAS superfamily LD-carboxypeptidase LdcB
VQLASQGGELAASEKYLKIISAFRSREYQDRLRKLEPGAGRAALAVNSPHFTGRALDLYVGGEPTITKDSNRALQTETRAYRWLVRNAERFGFCPYFYEPWHWEYCAQ